MLQTLHIKNFILIDELNLEFDTGLTVITGDTGAGKTILLKALLFCLNSKPIENPIKVARESCNVIASFTLNSKIMDFLSAKQIDYDDILVIKRIETLGQRKKFLINDQLVTAKTITEISVYLFELHGQNNHTILLNPLCHIDILDEYGQFGDLLNQVEKKHEALQNIKSQIHSHSNSQDKILEEIEYLEFISDELSQAAIIVGEEEKLANIRHSLQNQEKDTKLLRDLLSELESPTLSQIFSKILRILRINEQNSNLESIFSLIDSASCNIEEAKSQLSNIIDSKNVNKYNLDDVEERLFMIRKLARKHGALSDDLPQVLIDAQSNLYKLKQNIQNINQLNEQLIKTQQSYLESANLLSLARIEIAETLSNSVHAELQCLHMEKVKFFVQFAESNQLYETSKGVDSIRFMVSTNPGTPASPIEKIASGGELSRLMLALKSVFVNKKSSELLIFDEIDTGVSGSVAHSIGEHLKNISQKLQVLVITHQPQVAAKAEHHFLVSKEQQEQETNINVVLLNAEEKIQAAARMISGKALTANSLKAAEDLYNKPLA